jgi:hypothetical protein
MTSRKTAADDEGWRKGRGAYSKEVKLNRGSFPNSVPGTSPKGPGGKYTSDEQVTTQGHSRGPDFRDSRAKNKRSRERYIRRHLPQHLDDDTGGSRPGPIKYGVD